MNKTSLLLYTGLLLTSFLSAAPPFASWDKFTLLLNNGIVERSIQLPVASGKFLTTSYKPVSGTFGYFQKTSTDFQFEWNDKLYSGRSNWRLLRIDPIKDENSGNGAAVLLQSDDKELEVTVRYLLYPGSPAIHKNLVVKNRSKQKGKLESVDIEKFDIGSLVLTWIMSDYGRRKSIGPFESGRQDALVNVCNINWKEGIVIGNEATGIMKRTSVYWEAPEICAGLTHKDGLFPFRKWVNSSDSFQTPQVFTMVYNNQADPNAIMNTAVPDFVRKYMGIRLSKLKQKPIFVYNTWVPFKKNINEQLVMELAKSAADAGMKEFVIDDGWENEYGDWGIDKKKFPNGLKPVFDYIKSLGMRPGLWVSIGSVSPNSKVFAAHPEWFVKNKKGQFTSLHSTDENDKYTACFSTGWYDYIKKILLKFSVEYGLEYLKLDFAIVSSAYMLDHTQTGCYATNHPYHRDQHESLFVNYERMWQLFDELHAAKPEMFIDCTFETMGGLQLIDYALLKHAEGDALANFSGPGEILDLRMRNIAWWRSPAVPSTALVIGSPFMQDTLWPLHIKSLAGALPQMVGDPRKLPDAEFKLYRSYADWLQQMESKYGFMAYRQDLPGFGEPAEGMWDGFERINTETQSGGIIGVFRHGSKEAKRIITVQYLAPRKIYAVKNMLGEKIIDMTGTDLQEKGFEWTITTVYGGDLFEISEEEGW